MSMLAVLTARSQLNLGYRALHTQSLMQRESVRVALARLQRELHLIIGNG